jgi:hypothetical protein
MPLPLWFLLSLTVGCRNDDGNGPVSSSELLESVTASQPPPYQNLQAVVLLQEDIITYTATRGLSKRHCSLPVHPRMTHLWTTTRGRSAAIVAHQLRAAMPSLWYKAQLSTLLRPDRKIR